MGKCTNCGEEMCSNDREPGVCIDCEFEAKAAAAEREAQMQRRIARREACERALAGIPDPAAFVAAAREVVERWSECQRPLSDEFACWGQKSSEGLWEGHYETDDGEGDSMACHEVGLDRVRKDGLTPCPACIMYAALRRLGEVMGK